MTQILSSVESDFIHAYYDSVESDFIHAYLPGKSACLLTGEEHC